MKQFEVTIWEKAEHWTFTADIEATDEKDAWRVARKEFPKRLYSVRQIREIFR